jgi:hypothetical protein
MSGLANVLISDIGIIERFQFPEETRILDAKYDAWKRCVVFTVTHPDLPDIQEGELVPESSPRYHRNSDGTTNFVDWNVYR